MGRALRIICGVALALGLSATANEAAAQAERSAGYQDSAPSNSVPVGASAPEPRRERSENDQEVPNETNDIERSDLKAQQTMALFAGLQLVLTFFALLYIRWTLHETKIAAKAAEDIVLVTRQSAEAQLRAYVTMRAIYVTDVEPNKRPEFHFIFVNTGQTPAKLTSIIRIADVCVGPPGLYKVRSAPRLVLHFALGSGEKSEQSVKLDKPISEAVFSQFIAGHLNLVFAGVITYKDAFGVTRRTMFRGHAPNEGMTEGKLALHAAEKHCRSS